MQINGNFNVIEPVPNFGNTISDRSAVRSNRVRNSSRIRRTANLLSAVLAAAVLLSVIPILADADYEQGKREWDAGRPAEAMAMWQAAAGTGDRRAMLELGRMYRRGLGVAQDFIMAHMWLNLAAARGDIEAFDEREALAAKMTAQQLAKAQEMAREWNPDTTDAAKASTAPEEGSYRAETVDSSVSEPEPEAQVADSGSEVDSERAAVASDAPPEAIREAQMLLAALGYEPGEANGEWNVSSLQAYTKFLQDSGLPKADDLTVKMLVALRDAVSEKGIEVDHSASQPKTDPLIEAVLAGDIDGLREALDSGADVNATDSSGMTALMYAARDGDVRIIGSLLKVPAVDVDARAGNGMTALHIAVAYGHSQVIRQLMQAGADISVAGPDGTTAVDLAQARYGEVESPDLGEADSAVRALLQGMSLSEYEGILAKQAKEKEEQEALRQLQAEQERLRLEQEKLKAEREKLRLEQERLAEQEAERERLRKQKEEQERLSAQKAEEERKRLILAEQERLRKQKEERERLRRLYSDGKEFRDCDSCPVMVVVPAGTFTMGSPASEKSRNASEGPMRSVTIPEAFAAGKYEVTFVQWDTCVSEGGCSHVPGDAGWGRGNRPVINVSWNDAMEYVDWLGQKTGKRYRLLSEAEWEYAARAGTTGPFHFGKSISTDQANYKGFYTYGGGSPGTYRARTVPVGKFPGNAFGLHEVHGNVWEWVEDCWHGSYEGAPSDGSAWTSGGDCDVRVIRGGSQGSRPKELRSAVRSGNAVGNRNKSIGFRVGWTIAP